QTSGRFARESGSVSPETDRPCGCSLRLEPLRLCSRFAYHICVVALRFKQGATKYWRVDSGRSALLQEILESGAPGVVSFMTSGGGYSSLELQSARCIVKKRG